MRVLICGSREWVNHEAIAAEIHRLYNKYGRALVIIHGDARGADRVAGAIAESFGIAVEKYPADWQHHGKAAGPRRNEQMLTEATPQGVVAFNLGTAGTNHMIRIAKAAGLPVIEYRG